MTWYQSLLVSICGGVVAGFVTMWLSLRRFYRERWWQRRFDGCAAVIESLHDQKRYSDILWGEEAEGKEYDADFKNAAAIRSGDGARLIRRYADLGSLALPDEVAILLTTYLKEREAKPRFDTFQEYLEDQKSAETTLLSKVAPAAVKGLGLSRTWRNRMLGT
ncbi:hypothetical protein [Sphingomonas sp. Leaf230]|uniref:hypothetical protein n=1 Tax=Sphingomonas sp. Leaf230 TaxID=1735694 RepID=UPI000ACF447A|nr:hypothetical protein [Sphingomonas sp. Leaf230]